MPALVHTTAVLATINNITHAATVTIPSTTAGNCLVVVVQGENGSGSGSVTAITLGGSAGNFGSVKTVEKADSGNSVWTDVVVWADPNCAGSQTSVKVTFNANWAGNGSADITVYEVSGLVSTLASLLDQSSTGTGASTAYSSGTTATTTVAGEFWVGAAYAVNGITALPSSPWTDSGINTADSNAGCGSQITSSTGTALYNGSAASGTITDWAALVVTLKGTGSSPTPSPFTPFRSAKGRPAAVRGSGKGSPGAKYIFFPSKFPNPGKPAKGTQAAVRGSGKGISGKYVHVIPPGPSPFTLPARPAKGQTLSRGHSYSSPGAKYIFFPSAFFPPDKPARGAQAAVRGRSTSSPGARFVLIQTAPFILPEGPARGQAAVRRTGRGYGLPGARFVLIQTAPFTLPRKPARGQTATRRGSGLAGSATGQGAPFVPRKLIIAIASQAGKDDYGNPFVQGIQVNQGLIQGQVIAAESIVKGILAPGAVDNFTLNAIQVNSGTVVASDIIISGTSGGEFAYSSGGTITNVYTSSGSWKAPAGVTSIKCECWAGGGGGGGTNSSAQSGGGGGGGEYARENTLAVTPGTTYTFSVGAAGTGGGSGFSNGTNGGNTIFAGDSITVTAHGGSGGKSANSFGLGGAGGTGSTNSMHFSGGPGQSGANVCAGGGSGGTGSDGNPGGANGFGAAAVTGGGPGGDFDSSPVTGPGGGGGGYGTSSGANGWQGQIMITYTSSSPQLIASIAGAATTDPVAGVNVPEGMASDHYTVNSNASVPGTPSGGGVFWYDGSALWFKGTSGTAVKIATT